MSMLLKRLAQRLTADGSAPAIAHGASDHLPSSGVRMYLSRHTQLMHGADSHQVCFKQELTHSQQHPEAHQQQHVGNINLDQSRMCLLEPILGLYHYSQTCGLAL